MIFIWILNVAQRDLFLLGAIVESRDEKLIPLPILPVTDDLVFFLDTILKHFKWIMLSGPNFINDRGHIKTLKKFTSTVDFGILSIKIFLRKNIFWRTVGVIEILQNIHNNIWNFVVI